MEYLVRMTTRVPEGTSAEAVADVRAREAAHTRELAVQGRVLRLWRPPLAPGEWRSLGLFSAEDPDDLERTLASMPLRMWRTDEVTPLDPHPSDPGREAAPDRALAGQRVVVLGGSSGIGLETASDRARLRRRRRARRAGTRSDSGRRPRRSAPSGPRPSTSPTPFSSPPSSGPYRAPSTTSC